MCNLALFIITCQSGHNRETIVCSMDVSIESKAPISNDFITRRLKVDRVL